MVETYKGVELQSLSKDNPPDETDEVKNIKILDRKLEQYKMICWSNAPFPLNYLGHTKDTEALAIMIGFLIHEDLIFCGNR
jgi:hypothetical protein